MLKKLRIMEFSSILLIMLADRSMHLLVLSPCKGM